MKKCKQTNIALLFAALCVALVLCAACGKLTLSRPSGVYIDSDTLTLHWNVVNGADRYVVSVDGAETTVANNRYVLESLAEGTHVVKVRAAEKDERYKPSDWSAELTFTRERENGLTYTLNSDKKSYKVSGLGTAIGDIVVPETFRGKNVTAVADGAFAGKSTITSVTLGNNVTSVGSRAFYACSELQRISLPEGLLVVGQNAFQSCKSLTSVVLPDSLLTVGAEAFSYCSALAEVTFGSKLVNIGSNAFYRCSALTEAVLSDDILFVGEHAFDSCKSLTSVNVGGAQAIGNYAFNDCVLLDEFVGDHVTTVGMYAFGGCTSLASVNLERTTQIGDGAFYGCSALSDVQLSVDTERIGSYAFYKTALWNDADNLVYVGAGGALWWVVGCKNDTVAHLLTSDDDTEGLTDYVVWRNMTVGIADQAFMNYNGKETLGLTKLGYVHFPNTLRRVGAYAFYASSVQRVELGESTAEIGEYAFAYCRKLYQLNVYGTFSASRAQLTDIGNYAFYGCEVLGRLDSDDTVFPRSLQRIGTRAFDKTAFFPAEGNKAVVVGGWAVGIVGTLSVVNLTNGVYGIADYAFFKNSSITSVALGADVEHVGKGAFSKCTVLQSVDASQCKNLTTLADNAFYKCTLLEEALLPSSLKNIGRSVFSGCGNLSLLTFTVGEETSSLTTVGDYAFYGCTSLTQVTLPISAAAIGDNSFAKCAALTDFSAVGLVSMGERAFKGCEALTNVVFGDILTAISNRAFYGCVSLTTVKVPKSVSTIGNYAFYGCNQLADVQLDDGLTTIGTHAFFGCTELKSVAFPSSLKSIGAQAFRGCAGLSSVALRSGMSVDKHAFYGCTSLTVYAEDRSRTETWSALWNSSYRPVVWGCVLSTDGYVASVQIAEQTFANVKDGALSAPLRDGYVFAGWSLDEGSTNVDYTLDNFTTAPVGTVLYAVWNVAE